MLAPADVLLAVAFGQDVNILTDGESSLHTTIEDAGNLQHILGGEEDLQMEDKRPRGALYWRLVQRRIR